MRRVFKVKVFLVVVIILALLGAGTYYLHGYQFKKQVNIYLQKADQAVAEKDTQKAREYLERYIRLKPKDTEAFNRYAIMMDDSATTAVEKSRAYLQLEKALRQYVNGNETDQQVPVELHKRSAIRALELNRFRDGIVHLDAVLKAHPEQVEFLEMKAKCKVGLSQLDGPEGAEQLYQQIIAAAPSRVSSHKALADIYFSRKQYDKAENQLRKMVEKNGKSIEARLALISFLRGQGRLEDAAAENKITQEIMSEVKVDPADKARADWLYEAAQLALAQRKPKDKEQSQKKVAEALQLFTQGMEQFPKDIRFYLGKAQLIIAQDPSGRARTLEILHKAIPLVSEDPNEQGMITKLLIDAGEKEQAMKLMEKLRARFGANPVLEYFRARLLYDEGNIGAAITILERIKENLTRIPAISNESDVLLSLAYQRLDNPDRRLAAVDRILKLNADNPSAQVTRADILVSLGQIGEAAEIYRKQLAAVPSARLPLIRLLIAAQAKKPEQQRNWTEIATLLEQCSAEQKKTKDYVLTRLQYLSNTGKTEELEKAVDDACKADPKEASYWLAKLSFVRQRSGLTDSSRADAVAEILQEAEKAAGDRAEFRLSRALLALTQPREKMLPLLEALERNTEKWSESDRKTLQLGLANLYFSLGYAKDSKRLLRNVLSLDPYSFPAYQVLLDIAFDEKDDTESQRLINVLREKEGDEGFRWRLAAVNRLFIKLQGREKHELPEARKLVDELTRLRPGWFHTQTIQGKLSELSGMTDQAIELYKRAIEMGERDPEIVKKTVQSLALRRRPEDARHLLAVALDQSGPSPLYAKIDAELAMSTLNDPAQRLAKAKQAVPADSRDYRDHLWLGNVLYASGDKAGAESPLKRAVQLAPEAPETWANWISYLINEKRNSEADAELKRAESPLRDKITYVRIAYYQALGQLDKAEEQYAKLVNDNPDDAAFLKGLVSFHFRNGDLAKAETLLKKQIDSSLIDPASLSWARRSYAMTLAAKPDYQSFKEAISLVEKNLKENSTSPEDLRARALILSTRPGPRQDSIKDLEVSFTIIKPTPTEAVLLAQLYEDEGNWEKAKAVYMEMIASSEGKAPSFLANYILGLLRHKEVKNAEDMMKLLEEKASGQPIVVEPKARLLFAQGKSQEGIDLLQRQAAKWYSDRKDPSVYLFFSRLLEQVDQKQAAEEMVKAFVDEVSVKNPNAILALVELYARQGRISDAISVCEENWSKLPVGNVAMACVAALNTGKFTSQEIQRVETRLVAESKSGKFDLGVAMAIADLYRLLKRPVEAEAIYRTILKEAKDHPVALNNLAWMLSDRREAFNEAIELITRAIDKYGPDGAFLDTRGMIFLQNNKAESGLRDLQEAVVKSPTPGHLLHLAYAYHKAQNPDEAKKSWKKALVSGLKEDALSLTDQACFRELAKAYD